MYELDRYVAHQFEVSGLGVKNTVLFDDSLNGTAVIGLPRCDNVPTEGKLAIHTARLAEGTKLCVCPIPRWVALLV